MWKLIEPLFRVTFVIYVDKGFGKKYDLVWDAFMHLDNNRVQLFVFIVLKWIQET
jgi:hypothetical protein